MRIRTAWQITALIFLALSLVIIVIARNNYIYIDRLGPGPGFFPVWVGILNILFALIMIVQTVKGWDGLDASTTFTMFPKLPELKRSLTCLLGLVGSAILMELLGFVLTTFLFLAIVPFALGVRRWWSLLLFAIIGAAGTYYVLSNLLFVPLPLGIFWF